MSKLSIEIEGLEELQKHLNDPQILKATKDAMVKAQALVWRRIAVYPQAPGGSSYVRTGLLGRSWRAFPPKVSTRELSGEVGNPTVYAPFVQGVEQVGFHKRTGWKRLDDIANKAKKEIEGFFLDVLRRTVGRWS